MAHNIKNLVRRGTSFLSDKIPGQNGEKSKSGFSKALEGQLFTKVDPAVDGQDCEHDCESCTIKYPAKFSIDEKEDLYGHVNGWATHLLVATGKTDWVRNVEDEKGSVMEAIGKANPPKNGVSRVRKFRSFSRSLSFFIFSTGQRSCSPICWEDMCLSVLY